LDKKPTSFSILTIGANTQTDFADLELKSFRNKLPVSR